MRAERSRFRYATRAISRDMGLERMVNWSERTQRRIAKSRKESTAEVRFWHLHDRQGLACSDVAAALHTRHMSRWQL